ncbi:MAG TPA: DNRLRE domain-containing protein, partial [Streptosporangiaceae bacterium]
MATVDIGLNQYTASFARRAGSHYLRVRAAEQAFDFDAAGAAGAAGKVTGSYVSYAGAYPGADLTYDVGPDAVNETIVLHNASAPASYEFVIHPQGGRGPVSVQRLPGGSWGVYRGPGGGPVFVLQAPRAVDARAGRAMVAGSSPHAAMSVRVRGPAVDVRVSIDRAWLSSAKRVFPVRLDPTITIQPDSQDASFAANCGACTATLGDRLFIGADNSNVWRAALQFDLSSVPAGAAVTNAKLGLYDDGWCFTSSTGCGFSHTFEAHRMTAAWNTTSTKVSQLAFDASTLSSVTVTDGQVVGWLYWPVTATVQNWLTGAQPNDGLLLKQASEPLGSGGVALPSGSYAATTSVTPELQVSYTSDAVTLLPPATLHSNGAELTWTGYTGPSGAPFQRYAIYRSKTPRFTPSPATLLTTITDPAVTSYRDTTAAPGAAFTYAVVANSDKSNEVTVTLPVDGQATKTLQPDPSTAQDAYIDYVSGTVNCGNYGADPFIYVGSNHTGIFRG